MIQFKMFIAISYENVLRLLVMEYFINNEKFIFDGREKSEVFTWSLTNTVFSEMSSRIQWCQKRIIQNMYTFRTRC